MFESPFPQPWNLRATRACGFRVAWTGRRSRLVPGIALPLVASEVVWQIDFFVIRLNSYRSNDPMTGEGGLRRGSNPMGPFAPSSDGERAVARANEDMVFGGARSFGLAVRIQRCGEGPFRASSDRRASIPR